ncbi:MAG: Hsp70 family protein, partial [Alphaproteobacteria bacterium]
VKEAETNAAEDKKRRELVEVRNQADGLMHSTERSLKEHGDKIGADEKAKIEAAIADLKSALEGSEVETIRSKTQSLAEASMKLGEAMYKAAQAEAGNAGPGDPESGAAENAANGDGKVVDADFEEVDDDKKRAQN